MVDYVECIDWVTTLTITPKPGAVGSSPSTPANLGLRLYKGFKGLLKDLRDPFFRKKSRICNKNGKFCTKLLWLMFALCSFILVLKNSNLMNFYI